MNIDNQKLIDRLRVLAHQYQEAAKDYDTRYISSPAHEMLKMHDTLQFLALCMEDNTITLSDWPGIAYAFIKAAEKHLPKSKQHQEQIEE